MIRADREFAYVSSGIRCISAQIWDKHQKNKALCDLTSQFQVFAVN